MRDIAAELKALRLYGMVGAWEEIIGQGTLAAVESSRWLIEHLLESEHTDRAMRSIRYQMHTAKFPVHRDLAGFDFVLAKLDAPDMELFREINRPADGVSFGEILKGLILFSKGRRGRLAIQTMLIGPNKACAPELAALYAQIAPDEVQLNTPLRPCAQKPLSCAEVELACLLIKTELKRLGKGGIKVISVYSEKHPEVSPVSAPDTLKRRGKI